MVIKKKKSDNNITYNSLERELFLSRYGVLRKKLDIYLEGCNNLQKSNFLKLLTRRVYVDNIHYRVPRENQLSIIACYYKLMENYGGDASPRSTESIEMLVSE
jgi:hypothetical protein